MDIIQIQQLILFVILVKQHGERDRRLEEYYNKIRKIYPVDRFEIDKEDGTKLNFYREHVLLNLLEDKDDINVNSLVYNLYEKEWGDANNEIASINVDKRNKIFNISVWYNEKYENKGYARAIYLNARKILEILEIEDIEQYEITTPVDKATKHMKEKYGTLKDKFHGEEKQHKIVINFKDGNRTEKPSKIKIKQITKRCFLTPSQKTSKGGF